eukprot:TRINITY_DN5001_c0_g1_i1.p1 TRINITY_DN5001_c0_g1~~TRINITY_DN5001_c0_g1_i1.p1  ORF type:complete len:509 (-),score=68.17 TRINITY_DN5001_c0_g1_i1:59-1585(-)
MTRLTLLLFALVLFLGAQALPRHMGTSDANGDQITSLPGVPEQPSFDQYSGYVTVDESAGRALHYWFTESTSDDPTKDPVVLWLTGGPGCSSVGAFFTENGPWIAVDNGNSLELREYSWNRIANVIWLESPAGVGFSYSNTTSDYTQNVTDARTADDSYAFLLGFFERFPQFSTNPFWITGESYGGHYIPTLAQRIVEGNKQGSDPNIALVGFMAGNPWTYMPIDNQGAIDDWVQHSLLDWQSGNLISTLCNMSGVGPLAKRELSPDQERAMVNEEINCTTLLDKAADTLGPINIYDIYVNVCSNAFESLYMDRLAQLGSPAHQVMSKVHQQHRTLNDRSGSGGVRVNNVDAYSYQYNPCNDPVGNYMNRADVQAAININPAWIPTKGGWEGCSSVVQYDYHDVESSVIPVYEQLFHEKLHILVYSGDVDGIVPTTGTRAWIDALDRNITTPWHHWTEGGQVAGYATVYDDFTFTTIRNAGHMVPTFQPARGYAMFKSFLQNGTLPSN